MSSIIVYFKSLPPPVRWTTYTYITALLVYNGGYSYISAKSALIDYRNNNGEQFGPYLLQCKNDFEAVKFGSSFKFYNRFIDSIIWPVSVTSNIIPFVALKLNPPNTPKEL